MTPFNRRNSNFSSSSSNQGRGGSREDSSRRRRNANHSQRRGHKLKDEDKDFKSSYNQDSYRREEGDRPYRSRVNNNSSNKPFRTTKNTSDRSSEKNKGSSRYTQRGQKNYFKDKDKFPLSKSRRSDFANSSSQRIEKSAENFNLKDNPSDIFWGRHSTQAILESGRPVHRIWCTAELRSSPKFLQLLRDSKALGVLVEEVSWARLGHITNGGVHQGIALQTAASETLDLKSLIQGCREIGESAVLLALDCITDPHNVGAIVRSAEALGAHGLVLPQRRSAGLTGSVAKVAAGALEHLPVARVINLNRSLEELKKEGYRIIGLAEEGKSVLNEIDLTGPMVLVIGSEGKGLSLLTRRNCDHLIRIPLRGVTSSLNASVATSIALYEIAQNGWMKGMKGQAPSPKLVRAKLSNQPII